MKISCQSWSSVDVTYVQPPQVNVRNMPTPATNLGRDEFGRRVRTYHRPTSAKRGPANRSIVSYAPLGPHRTGCEGDEQHKDGSFWVAVANGR
jgi:hypothetical protein